MVNRTYSIVAAALCLLYTTLVGIRSQQRLVQSKTVWPGKWLPQLPSFFSMNKHLRRVQASLWSTLVHSTVHWGIIASHPGSASQSPGRKLGIQKTCADAGTFLHSLYCSYTLNPYSETLCECVLQGESCHVVLQSMDRFDLPPCSQIKVYESLTGIF